MRGTYTGDLVDGIRQGHGILVFANGDKYDGAFVNGFRHGHGVFICERGLRVYDGSWKRSVRCGHGKERYGAAGASGASGGGDRYEGEFKDDLYHGKGVLVRGSSGSKYEGEFVGGKRHGYGRMEFGSSPSSIGSSNNTHSDEKGMVAAAQKTKGLASSSSSGSAAYEGQWKAGRMHGEGKYTRRDGSFYEGSWSDGLAHGLGKEVTTVATTGEVYEGNWKQGKRHGDGAVIKNGKKRKGVWEMGARVKWTTAEVAVVGGALPPPTMTAAVGGIAGGRKK